MASTRDNNTPANYCLQQRGINLARQYVEYKYSQAGRAYKNALPCPGITPSHMPREAFSYNSVAIESALFGINANNLVNPQPTTVPEFKSLPMVSYFERTPRLVMPSPLIVENNQRPFPIPQ